jgi:hypothetical protein
MITTLPPNGLSIPVRSLNVLSTASKVCLCCIGASSHMIMSATWTRVRFLPRVDRRGTAFFFVASDRRPRGSKSSADAGPIPPRIARWGACCELCVPALFFLSFVASVRRPRGSNSYADAGPLPSTRRSLGSVTEGERERQGETRGYSNV